MKSNYTTMLLLLSVVGFSSIHCSKFQYDTNSSDAVDLSEKFRRPPVTTSGITLKSLTLSSDGNAYLVVGTAPANMKLTLLIDGQLWRQDFAADSNGNYSTRFTFNNPAENYRMAEGTHTASVSGVLSTGSILNSSARSFAIAPATATQPTPTPTPTNSSVGLITGFKSTPDASFFIDGLSYHVESPGKSWSLNMLDSTSLRFELRSGDRYCTAEYCDPASAERTEITDYKDVYVPGTPIYVSYKFSMDAGSPITSDWFLLGQMHDVEVDSSPPFSIQMLGERMAVSIAWLRGKSNGVSSVWDTTVGGMNVSYGFVYTDPNPIQRGHLYDMSMTIKFDKTNGQLMIVRDGVTIVNYKGPLGFGYPNKWEYGIYRSSSPQTIGITYRNMRIGTSP